MIIKKFWFCLLISLRVNDQSNEKENKREHPLHIIKASDGNDKQNILFI